eukprot:TRINITY_DN66527_c6_g4_i2.p1 TRINITY_DN66527_c6_g4~~TRINITY_DN66527_c6_g4_i2.p1  ORF type:complete len:619 (-),score=85.79 TRINITY_DN66527_c6_g4_i2:296-2152(-)
MLRPVILCLLLVAVSSETWKVEFNNNAGSCPAHKNVDQSCKAIVVGAGPGGVYSAWRLQTSGKYGRGEVCIFERNNRVGGRVNSVRGFFPEHPKWTFDVGAYRFHTVFHPMVTALHEHFQVPIRCYKNPIGLNPECSSVLRGAYLRGQWHNADELKTSDGLGYNIDADERWGPENSGAPRTGHPRTYDYLFGNPGLPELASRLASGAFDTPATAWQAVDDISREVQTATFQGIPYSQLSLAEYASLNGVSDEALHFFFDADWETGETALSRQSLEYLAIEYARYFALLSEKSGDMHIAVTEDDLPAGYDTYLMKMLDAFTTAGGRVYFNNQLTDIEIEGNCPILEIGGHYYKPESAVLNMPSWDLMQLGRWSSFWQRSSPEFLASLGSLENYPLFKVYLAYNDAWWYTKLNWDNGRVKTSKWTTQMRFHDGVTECDNVAQKINCRGALLATYMTDDGWWNNMRWADSNTKEADPWSTQVIKFRRGQSSAQTEYFIDQIHQRVFETLHDAFLEAGLTEAEINTLQAQKPYAAIGGDWANQYASAVHIRQPSNNEVNWFSQQKPIQGVNLFLANEGFGMPTAWSEGSLVAAERVMAQHFGLPMPAINIPRQYWETFQKWD